MEPKSVIVKPSWTERFNVHRIFLGGTVLLEVFWSEDRKDPGYVVNVNRARLTKNAPDVETAKRWAIAAARKSLARALEELADLAAGDRGEG